MTLYKGSRPDYCFSHRRRRLASARPENRMAKLFPRTVVGGVSVSRMVIGTNWILGWSHTGAAADRMILQRNHSAAAIADLLGVFLSAGVDTIMGPFAGKNRMLTAIRKAEEHAGRRMILVDTPVMNVEDSAAGRREAAKVVARSRKLGATFCFPHHSSVEQLVCKHTQTIDRLPDYLKMIRDEGLVPGLSAHMPELVLYSDLNEYDVETYIQIYNCLGFLMQVEVEYIHKVIWNARKPVMTIKAMAAGRVSPFVGLSFSWNTLRPCDMITVGCLTPDEAAEDIEISRAALEHRMPRLAGRSSPNRTAVIR